MLKMGSVSIHDVLVSTDEVVRKTKVLTILESLPKLGKVKSRRLMEEVGIAETRRVQGLGEQQKIKLLAALDGA